MNSYRSFAEDLSWKAGEMIKKGFLEGVSTDWKKDSTPVTEIDRKINTFVINSIKNKYPTHSIVAEEESSITQSDYVWVCDPIDGTIPFSSGFPISVFTISLVYRGEVILGIIYDPYMERFVIAEKGQGAFLNGKRISVSTKKEIENTIINVESLNNFLFDLTPLYSELLSRNSIPTMIRSTVYAGMLIAMGKYAGAIFGGKSQWDGAAVKIIVEEAGGKVTDLYGNDQRYDKELKGFIASNGWLHNELVEIVKKSVNL